MTSQEQYQQYTQNILNIYHENSKYTALGLSWASNHPAPTQIAQPPLPTEPFTQLPQIDVRQPLNYSLQKAIQLRHTIREYSNQLMTPHHLSQFLAYSVAAQRRGSRAEIFADEPNVIQSYLHYYLFLWGVDGIVPGTYYYDPIRQGLVRMSDGPSREETVDALFQREFATGTGIILLAGDLQAATTAYGLRGYRYLITEAGKFGEAAYLVGTALDIGVCGNGGLHEKFVHKYAQLDENGRDLVWTVPFGLRIPA